MIQRACGILRGDGGASMVKCPKVMKTERNQTGPYSLYLRRTLLFLIATLSRRQLLQLGEVAIEPICIAAISVRVCILPNRLKGPSARDRPDRTPIACQHERTRGVECSTLAGALTPPVVGAVDHGVARRLGVILGDERLDPGNHFGLAKPVAGRTVGVVLDVEHARERDAILGPAAAMGEEKCRLCAASARVRVGEMVTASDQTGACCSAVMAGEV